jgi:hypothetical protein
VTSVFPAQCRVAGREMEWVESNDEFVSRGINEYSPLVKGDQGGCERAIRENKDNPLDPPLLRGNSLSPISDLLKKKECGGSVRGARESCK